MIPPPIILDEPIPTRDPSMRLPDFRTSTSIAVLAASPYGSRIAFAPETGAGSGGAGPVRKPDAVRRDAARKDDAPAGEDRLDKLLSMMGQIGDRQEDFAARLDALEKTKEAAAPDPDEADKEEAAKADGALPPGAEREIGAIRGRMTYAERCAAEAAEEHAMAMVQAKADNAWNLHGLRAPAPMVGETRTAYRVRLAGSLQKFSPGYKDVNLAAVAKADPGAFDVIESTVYADSAKASERPAGTPGELMPRTRKDPGTGRETTTFHGPDTFVKFMRPPVQRFVKSFNTGLPHQAHA